MSEITLKSMLDNELSADEQQIFLYFQQFNDNDPETDFVVDLDFAFKYIGFKRKNNAKRLLDKYFTPNTDFSLIILKNNKEKIELTVNTFKAMCMLANTEKGKQFRRYYTKIGYIMYKYIKLQQDMTTKKLTKIAEEAANMELAFEVERDKINRKKEENEIASNRITYDEHTNDNENVPLVYLAEIGELPDERILLKFGVTDDISNTETYLRKKFGAAYSVKHFESTRPHQYEQWLKKHRIFVMCKYNEYINEQRHDKVLAVTEAQYTAVKMLMRKHVYMFEDWSDEQEQ